MKTGLGNRRRSIKEQKQSAKGGATIKGLGEKERIKGGEGLERKRGESER